MLIFLEAHLPSRLDKCVDLKAVRIAATTQHLGKIVGFELVDFELSTASRAAVLWRPAVWA